jgi:nitrate/nitrite-specific signal transduction histidine kinase
VNLGGSSEDELKMRDQKQLSRSQRRDWRNFLLPPIRNQIEICLLSAVLAIGFAALITITMRWQAEHLRQLLLQEQTDMARFSRHVAWLFGGLIVFFFVVNFVVFVIFTHRIAGPVVAFRRHIHKLIEGDFKARIRLRRRDKLSELAEDLNRLSETLNSNFKNDKAAANESNAATKLK